MYGQILRCIIPMGIGNLLNWGFDYTKHPGTSLQGIQSLMGLISNEILGTVSFTALSKTSTF